LPFVPQNEVEIEYCRGWTDLSISIKPD